MFIKHDSKTSKKQDDISRSLQNEKNSNYYSVLKKYVFLQKIMLIKHNVFNA